MCFSAITESSWRDYARHFDANISLKEFRDLMNGRLKSPKDYRLPRGMDLMFAEGHSAEEREIQALADRYRKAEIARLEPELLASRKGLAEAERKLALKQTKAALDSRRIASKTLQLLPKKLALFRDDRKDSHDWRIFPKSYAALIVMREGKRTIVPARYLLRQPGARPLMDTKLSGNYNARRDNLQKLWKEQFGRSHALLLVHSFFENVTGPDGRNRVLHFTPKPAGLMHVACLYSEWLDPKTGERLLSFAAITDEPSAEVAAAGHDRMIVNLRLANVNRWLTPQGRGTEELQSLLDEREPAIYEHELAA